MRTLLSWFIASLALACVSCSSSGDARSDAPHVEMATPSPVARLSPVNDALPRIVFMGDSLTAGYGLAREEAVPALVEERLLGLGYQYRVVAQGVSGDTSAGGLSRLEHALEGDVRVLVIELGANDGLRGLPPASLKQNLAAIMTAARSRGITVLLTGMEAPPNFGAAYTDEFRAVYRELADEFEVAFVPFYLEGVAGVPELNLADGMHPNAEGSRRIAETVWAALEPLLERPRGEGAAP